MHGEQHRAGNKMWEGRRRLRFNYPRPNAGLSRCVAHMKIIAIVLQGAFT